MSSATSKPRKPDVPRNLKLYFLCLLRKGPQWNVTEGHEELMPQYLAYLRRETESRRMIFAGPVTEGEVIAVAVLQTAAAEEAAAIVDETPGVKSGHFVAEVHPCYLPALDGVSVRYEDQ